MGGTRVRIPDMTTDTRYLQRPLTEKGPYFQKSGCENRTPPQKLSTCGDPRATSFSENRTPRCENHTLPMAGSCSQSAGLGNGWRLGIIAKWPTDMAQAGLTSAGS